MVVAKTVKESLRMLWQEGFFKESGKAYKEVKDGLHKAGYHFEQSALSHALAKTEFLVKETKDNKAYIQKYPHSEEKKNG